VSTKLKTESIDGYKFDIEILDSGEFYTRIHGEEVEAPSLKGLTDKVRKMIRRAGRIAVPVTHITTRYRHNKETPEVTQVILTGIHGSNRNILYKDEKTGESEQASYSSEFYKRLTGEEIAAYIALVKAAEAASRAVETWKEKHRVNPHQLIEQAAEKTETKPADPDEARA
jgi:hypothetical protein